MADKSFQLFDPDTLEDGAAFLIKFPTNLKAYLQQVAPKHNDDELTEQITFNPEQSHEEKQRIIEKAEHNKWFQIGELKVVTEDHEGPDQIIQSGKASEVA